MKLSRKQLQGLGTGLQMGGIVAQGLDSDREGADDELGRAFTLAGIALSQLSAGVSVSKKARAAEALRAVSTVCASLADEMEGEGK